MRDDRNNPQRASTSRPHVSRPSRDPTTSVQLFPPATSIGGEWFDDVAGEVDLNIFFSHPITLDVMVAADWIFNQPVSGGIYDGSSIVSVSGTTLAIKVFAAGPGNRDGVVHYINNGNRLKGPGGVPVGSFDQALDFGG